MFYIGSCFSTTLGTTFNNNNIFNNTLSFNTKEEADLFCSKLNNENINFKPYNVFEIDPKLFTREIF